MAKKILVLSPHLDDAVLSCADHILEWKKQGHDLTVVSIFTKFQNNYISQAAKNSLYKAGFKDAEECEKLRKEEDREAMKKLGVCYQHLDFVDGWYRIHEKSSVYPNQTLFSGHISNKDSKLISELKNKLQSYRAFEMILIPFGVGKHADHLVARSVAETVFHHHNLWFYVDFPYIQNWRQWNTSLGFQIIAHNLSLKLPSGQKYDAIYSYKSQYPLLFGPRIKLFLPELVMAKS